MENTETDSGPPPRAAAGAGFVSLASRLALVIFALVASVSLLIALELTRRERGHYVESKRSAGVMLTELFAASIAPALDFADAEAVRSSLGTLAQNPEVLSAAVWSQSDPRAPLAELTSAPNVALAAHQPEFGVMALEGHIDIVRPVQSPTGKELGAVAVRVSLARENAAFASARRRIFWMAFGLSALVAGLLVAVVRRTIVTPLRALETAARRLARGELTLVVDGRDDEVGSLGRTFNGMAHAIAEREERISKMNDRLQGLLDNMRQAIVVFERGGLLAEERSRLARRLFGDAGTETHIAEVLYPASSASEVEREAFGAWLDELAVAPEEEVEELLSLAPREATLSQPGGDEQILELEFRRAPSEGGVPRFMLLATDVTTERRLVKTAESQALSHQKQLTAARRLLAGGGQLFVRFIAGARERLQRAEGVVRDAPGPTQGVLEELFRFVHTLRAEARSFDLDRVEALASDLEVALSGARPTPLDSPLRSAALAAVEAGLAQFHVELDTAEQRFVESSPIGRRVLEQVTVSREDVDALYQRFGREPGELGKLVARLAARPFGELVAILPEEVRRWSEKEGKRVELVIGGRETLVPPALCESLGGVLAHLLRNAVAHGIETPAERVAKHKVASGRIDLTCEDGPDGVSIAVADDGAGFDLTALRRQAEHRGHTLAEAGLDALDVAALDGVSTREVKDELAGQGVGLGAVRDDLSRVGYAIRLAPVTGHGTRIVLQPALPLRARSAPPRPLAEACNA